jgi:DNA-binding MarR family transcriptional regulator
MFEFVLSLIIAIGIGIIAIKKFGVSDKDFSSGFDASTGEIDLDILYTGESRSLQTQLQKVLVKIADLERSGPVSDEDLFKALEEDEGIERVKAEKLIQTLIKDGTIYKSRSGMSLLTAGPLMTLSYVAYHQPIEQKDVIIARGSQADNHLRTLENIGLIKRQKQGRTRLITTTPDFADYFGLNQDRTAMRRQLRSLFRRLEVSEIDGKDEPPEPQ